MAANGFDDDQTRSFTNLVAGTIVSHYKIISKIGAGGMGEVYLAEDTQLDRKIALKFLPPHLSQDEAARARFTREAKAAAKLDHPNIVQVFEVGEFQGRPFFAMAHIEGKSLRVVIKEGKLTVNEAIEYTKQICEGLHKAHESGVVHRDIKPGNIIIDKDNKARILDFGLATVAGEDKLTKTGWTLGTVGYMSPEQIEGKQVDHRSDLFSVGVILYEMLTGRRPFEGDNDAAVARSITDKTPEPIARYKSGTTGQIQQVVDKALMKDPSLRYQHADGMLADLKLPQNEQASDSRPLKRKMIAVLPFDNLGSNADEYFADGITGEIMSRLTSIGQLGVIARTSCMHYKGTDKSTQQIAQELGVEYILEGTIRWHKRNHQPDLVRITPTLVQASDTTQLWADNYSREFTEIFDIQTEIAERVADSLQITLRLGERQRLDQHFTENMKAYQLYLRGKYFLEHPEQSTTTLRKAKEAFQQAIREDPTYVSSRAGLAITHMYIYGIVDNSPEQLGNLKEAIDAVLAIEDSNPDGLLALAQYYWFEDNRNDARKTLANAERGSPENPRILLTKARWKRHEGDLSSALDQMIHVHKFDPCDAYGAWEIGETLKFLGRYAEAIQYYDLSMSLNPAQVGTQLHKAWVQFLWRGNYKEASELLGKVSREPVNEFPEMSTKKMIHAIWLACLARNFSIATDILGSCSEFVPGHRWWGSMVPKTLFQGLIQFYMGEIEKAKALFEESAEYLTESVKEHPRDCVVRSCLGISFAGIGDHKRAIECCEESEKIEPYSRSAIYGAVPIPYTIRALAMIGEYNLALERLEKFVDSPQDEWSGLTLGMDPAFDPLHDDPRFKTLVQRRH